MGKQLEGGWRKPRRSGTNGNCVEVASADSVMIRDTKDRDGVTLSIPADAWQEFVAGLR